MRRTVLIAFLFETVMRFATWAGSEANAASFQGLGGLPPHHNSEAVAISADGSIVAGNSSFAFRWTQSGGMVSLGDLDGGSLGTSEAHGISADGSVVVGWASSPPTDPYGAERTDAFRWTEAEGMVGLGGALRGAVAQAVSSDGSVVVGRSEIQVDPVVLEAFRWTVGGGAVGLGHLPGLDLQSSALGVSADGSVVVGVSGGFPRTEAFRWTAQGGMVGLGDLPGGDFRSSALGVSADGKVVVGYGYPSSTSYDPEAFRWTEAEGMVGLGDLPGNSFRSVAEATSANGSVVVGSGYTDSGETAFIWTPGSGMRSVRDVLVNEYGLNLTGWRLTHATAISADGLTITGLGSSPTSPDEAWIATIPEPSTALFLASGLIVLAVERKRSVYRR
jgi:probable HAF family extracellular repeat protein